MSSAQSVPFDTKGGSPTRLEVTLPNGDKYELRVALSVTDVTLLEGARDPSDPSLPAFNIQAHFAATTRGSRRDASERRLAVGSFVSVDQHR